MGLLLIIELEEPALLILSRNVGRSPSSDNVAQFLKHKMPKTHDVKGNSFVAKKGRTLCDTFNTGAYVFNPQNTACPSDGTLVHQCSRSLDASHGAYACPRTDFPATRPIVEGLRGKSKGFGKRHEQAEGTLAILNPCRDLREHGPGVLERSLDIGDVLVGNINGESKSLVDFVTSGIRESVVVLDGESVSKTMATRGNCG